MSDTVRTKSKKGGRKKSAASADEYEGDTNKEGKREGRGTCRFAGGDVYEGEWKGGKMDGRGTYKMADGDVYEGTWKAGNKEGPGTYWYASGRADVSSFSGGRDAGEGARWSVDRLQAWRLQNGELVEEITTEEAAAIAERIGEPVPPQVSATSPLLRATGGIPVPSVAMLTIADAAGSPEV